MAATPSASNKVKMTIGGEAGITGRRIQTRGGDTAAATPLGGVTILARRDSKL